MSEPPGAVAGLKRAFSPPTLAKNPSAKRPKTSTPSTIKGLGDEPVDVGQRTSFLNVTQMLLNAGAVPIDSAVEEFLENDRQEAEILLNPQLGGHPPGVVSVDDSGTEDARSEGDMKVDEDEVDEEEEESQEEEEEEALEQEPEPEKIVPEESEEIEDDEDDEDLALDANGHAIVKEKAMNDEGISRPSNLLNQFWRDNVSKLHPPKFSLTLLSSSNVPIYGCTLVLYLPPSSTRMFTVQPSFASKKDAKDGVCKLALMHGLLEEGKKARERVGEEVDGEGDDDDLGHELRDNAVGELTKWWNRVVDSGELIWEYSHDELNSTYGCTLKVPLPSSTSDFSQININIDTVYQTPAEYSTRKEAKDAAARLALKDNILSRLDQLFRAKIVQETGGYISFTGTDDGPIEVETDISGVLARDWVKAGGGAKGLVYTSSFDSDNGPKTTHGVTLVVRFTATHSKTFEVPPIYRMKRDARMAAAARALKNGVVDEMQKLKGTTGVKELKAELSAQKKKYLSIPEAGTVKDEEWDTMHNPGGYLNVCHTTWIKNNSVPAFHYEMDATTEKFAAKVDITIPFTGTKSYSVPCEFTNKKAARDAVVRLAFKDKVLDLMKEASEKIEENGDDSLGFATSRDQTEWGRGRGRGGSGMRGGRDGNRGGRGGRGGGRGGFQRDGFRDRFPRDDQRDGQRQSNGDFGRGGGFSRPQDNGYRPQHQNGAHSSQPRPFGDDLSSNRRPEPPSFLPRHPDNGYYSSGAPPNSGRFEHSETLNRGPPPHQQNGLSSVPFTSPQRQLGIDGRNGHRDPPFSGPPPPSHHQFGQPRPSNHLNSAPPFLAAPSINPLPPSTVQPSSSYASAMDHVDSFCQSWMGPSHRPTYEVRQHAQTGMFAAVVRVLIAPQNTQSFWVDHDFRSRDEAQEAVARLALREGLIEIIKREFIVAPPPPLPPPAYNSSFAAPNHQSASFHLAQRQAPLANGQQDPRSRFGANFSALQSSDGEVRPPPQTILGNGPPSFERGPQGQSNVGREGPAIFEANGSNWRREPPTQSNSLPKTRPPYPPQPRSIPHPSVPTEHFAQSSQLEPRRNNVASSFESRPPSQIEASPHPPPSQAFANSMKPLPNGSASSAPWESKTKRFTSRDRPTGSQPPTRDIPVNGAPLDASTTSLSTKDVVLNAALRANIAASLKEAGVKEWGAKVHAETAPSSTSSSAPAPRYSTTLPTSAPSATSSTIALSTSASALLKPQSSLFALPPPKPFSFATPAPFSSTAVAPLPPKIAPAPASARPSSSMPALTTSHANVTKSESVSSAKVKRSSCTLLQDFCKENGLTAPQFNYPDTDDLVSGDTGARGCLVVGGNRFEIPTSTLTGDAAMEKLASRVLKHLLKEKASKEGSNAPRVTSS